MVSTSPFLHLANATLSFSSLTANGVNSAGNVSYQETQLSFSCYLNPVNPKVASEVLRYYGEGASEGFSLFSGYLVNPLSFTGITAPCEGSYQILGSQGEQINGKCKLLPTIQKAEMVTLNITFMTKVTVLLRVPGV